MVSLVRLLLEKAEVDECSIAFSQPVATEASTPYWLPTVENEALRRKIEDLERRLDEAKAEIAPTKQANDNLSNWINFWFEEMAKLKCAMNSFAFNWVRAEVRRRKAVSRGADRHTHC